MFWFGRNLDGYRAKALDLPEHLTALPVRTIALPGVVGVQAPGKCHAHRQAIVLAPMATKIGAPVCRLTRAMCGGGERRCVRRHWACSTTRALP